MKKTSRLAGGSKELKAIPHDIKIPFDLYSRVAVWQLHPPNKSKEGHVG